MFYSIMFISTIPEMIDQIHPASEFKPCSIFNTATKNSSVPRNIGPDSSTVNICMHANINLQFIAHGFPSWIANLQGGEKKENQY